MARGAGRGAPWPTGLTAPCVWIAGAKRLMAPQSLPFAVKGRVRTCGHRDKLPSARPPAPRTAQAVIMSSHAEKGLEMSERGQGSDVSVHAQAPPRLSKADKQKTKIDLMKVRAVRA